jgi:hypothetical protein
VDNKSDTPSAKKQKTARSSRFSMEDGVASDSEEASDLTFLFSDDDEPTSQAKNKGKGKSNDAAL